MDVIENFGTILTIVALLISVPSAAGAVYFIVRGSLQTAQIEALRKDNDDLRKRVDDKEEIIEENEKDTTQRNEDNKVLLAENARLWEQLTQKADVEGVKSLLATLIASMNAKDKA